MHPQLQQAAAAGGDHLVARVYLLPLQLERQLSVTQRCCLSRLAVLLLVLQPSLNKAKWMRSL
jgi:hypothetical protein